MNDADIVQELNEGCLDVDSREHIARYCSKNSRLNHMPQAATHVYLVASPTAGTENVPPSADKQDSSTETLFTTMAVLYKGIPRVVSLPHRCFWPGSI